ncbi:hypothetical protein C1H46_008762 [Malus baccata]|uniref:Uncharacterized protein n=1 Tax=Malus baccata TaxID=106549 RepID=A0A540N3Q4_MALBA|nr:hypothetical protein C1H46_008762 [Malus baccata]
MQHQSIHVCTTIFVGDLQGGDRLELAIVANDVGDNDEAVSATFVDLAQGGYWAALGFATKFLSSSKLESEQKMKTAASN